MSIISYPYTKNAAGENLVEVVDADLSPIMVVDIEEARIQRLTYKAVAVALYNAEKKFFLVKRAESQPVFPGRWSLGATCFVRAAEALEDAALRALDECTGLTGVPVRFRAALKTAPGPVSARLHIFLAGPVKAKPTLASAFGAESMFLDLDELTGLKETFPEMLTPWLSMALDMGILE